MATFSRQSLLLLELLESTAQKLPQRKLLSSLTSFPASIVSFNLFPSSEPEATIALNISPVARWHTQYVSARRGAWTRKKSQQFSVIYR